MPLVRVNADDVRHRLRDTLDPSIKPLHPDAPVLVMVHGYKYAPGHARRCPHRSILSLAPDLRHKRCRSWPGAMGFTGAGPDEGLAVAFGWRATGTILQAAEAADDAGAALGDHIARLSEQMSRPVHILAHSLGARVALSALRALPQGRVGRIVLLHGAEFRSRARAMLDTPAGRTAEVINVTTRENDLFDGLFRSFVAPHRPFDPALSAGLGAARPNWLDIRIDDPASRRGLAALGFDIPAPEGRVCHWSAYMREGMFDLHSALIRSPRAFPLARLTRHLPDGARRGILEAALAHLTRAPLPAVVRVSS